jgi:hypothetical protein
VRPKHAQRPGCGKQITRSASGITKEAMTDDFGVVPTQGAWAFISKKTAPVSRTPSKHLG